MDSILDLAHTKINQQDFSRLCRIVVRVANTGMKIARSAYAHVQSEGSEVKEFMEKTNELNSVDSQLGKIFLGD